MMRTKKEYQEAFENIIWNFKCVRTEAYKDLDDLKVSIDLLKELVDKETPKKPYINSNINYDCPKCYETIESTFRQYNLHGTVDKEMSYCPFCSQKLDWSENE